MDSLKKIISENLIALRKENKMTQSELAEKLSYSDKAISKWEHGETLPDIEVLSKIADMYGVTFDYLIHKGSRADKQEFVKKEYINKLFVSLLGVSFVWILASIIFVYVNIISNTSVWTVFVWAVPISFLVLIIFNRFLKYKNLTIYYISSFVWSLLVSLYLQMIQYNIWLIFILGIPVQISIILWGKVKNK